MRHRSTWTLWVVSVPDGEVAVREIAGRRTRPGAFTSSPDRGTFEVTAVRQSGRVSDSSTSTRHHPTIGHNMQVTPRHGRFELSQIPVWWVVGVLAAVIVAGPFEGNDYPAQVYHTVFAEHLGEVFNLQWFSGHHVAGYGVLLAPVAAVLGIGVTGIVCSARGELGVRPTAGRVAGAADRVVVVRRRHARQPADRAAPVRARPRPRAVRPAGAAPQPLPARPRAGRGHDARQPGRRRLPRPGDGGLDAGRRPRPAVARRRAGGRMLRSVPRVDAAVPVRRLVPLPRQVVRHRRRHLAAADRVGAEAATA